MQFYISVMFLGLPDDIQEEKTSFLQFEKNALPTDQPTDGPTDRRTDGRTDKGSYRVACPQLITEKKCSLSGFVNYRARNPNQFILQVFQKGNTIKKAHDTSATRKSDIRLSVSDNVLQPQYHGMITFRPITHIFGAICP